MLISEIIRHKRDGARLTQGEVEAMVAGITDGSAGDDQVAAFAMAVYFKSMDAEEAAFLTLAMRDSGDVFDWSHLPGPVIDKHSTGGVGDNVSLLLAPIIAACGGYVPMISGRGLGHTGGTLDKMDAIPGYTSQPDKALLGRVVEQVGCAIIGQTGDLAPADKRFYAIRDVTATVESVPLITASILSKKLAAGLGGLVMDVKVGNGAFMDNLTDARELAISLTRTAQAAGLPCHALLTDMNQPLASAAGNAVEVQNAVDFLTGSHRDARLEQVTLSLCGEMLMIAKLAKDRADGERKSRNALQSGAAAERFGRMVAALGGPADLVEHPRKYLASAPVIRPFVAPKTGFVADYATRSVGLVVVELGGGRRKASDMIDPAVGLTGLRGLGTNVKKGDTLAMIHAENEADAARAEQMLLQAIQIGEAPAQTQAIIETITGA